MSIFDDYRNRLALSGNSDPNALFNSTQNSINNLFDQSPFYANIPIGSNNVDVRILDGTTDTMRELTFRPSTTVNMGDYATFYDRTWMVTSFFYHPLYPRAEVEWCTNTLKWKDKDGNLKSYACSLHVATKRVAESNGREFIVSNMPMYMDVQMNSDTLSIQKGLRFISGGQAFQIAGVDTNSYVFDGHGWIMFGCEYTTINADDDLVNSIADNSVYYRAFGNEQPTGGVIKW